MSLYLPDQIGSNPIAWTATIICTAALRTFLFRPPANAHIEKKSGTGTDRKERLMTRVLKIVQVVAVELSAAALVGIFE
jgi:hypothetical protein